jgi:phage shock protein A
MAALEMEKAQLKQEIEISDETIEKLKEQVKDYKEDIEAYKDEKAELLAENTARQEQLEETEEQL